MRKSPSRDPDEGFGPENYSELNEAFYGVSPAEYFMRRLTHLALAIDKGDDIDALLREGVAIGPTRLQLEGDPDSEDAKEYRSQRDQFASAEAWMLLHHASETVLRLYLAHDANEPCPPLAVARHRTAGAFKRAVEARFVARPRTDTDLAQNGKVFYGSASGGTVNVSTDDFRATCDNIEALLRMFARVFLDSAAYNAAKHGFALQPGRSQVTLDIGGENLGGSVGPHLDFLDIRKRDDGDRRWVLATRWLDIARIAQQVYLAHRLIESIWLVGRWRHLGEQPEAFPRLDRPRPADLYRDPDIKIMDLTRGFVYYEDPSSSGNRTS